jgi:NADH-quinone oxidoreductase subunit M
VPLLSTLVFLPAVGGLAAALLCRWGIFRAGRVAIVFALATFGLSIALLADFDSGQSGLQQVEDFTWISELGIHYKLGVDGINLFLILLTTLLWVGSTAGSMLRSWEKPGLYYMMLGLAETATLGAFCAQDLALFVLFFDLMLVPFYFLIGIWGGPERVQATTKFVIYTLVGSLLMLVAAVATGTLATPVEGGQTTFVISELAQRPLSEGSQQWIFLFFAAAFLVKMPAFPLHAWMPDAYRAAPTPVLAVLAGVLSKVGAYGFLRIVLPLFPDASVHFQELMLVIALASILYGSVMAFTQNSAILVVGYSSIAQLGFITLGIFALREEGAQGAVIQMVNHGLVVAPLFFIIALLAARAGDTDDLRKMGGIAFRAPVLAALFLIVALATLAMPGSANFVGEFLILTGVLDAKIVFAVVAGVGVVLAAVYTIRLYQRSMHNPVGEAVESREMSVADGFVLVPTVAAILVLALYPQLVLDRSEESVASSVQQTQSLTAEKPTAQVPP